MNNHLTTFSQSKKLKEIGVKQDSLWYWGCLYGDWYTALEMDLVKEFGSEKYSAFTLSELIEVLGEGLESVCHAKDQVLGKWEAYGYWNGAYHLSGGATPINAAVDLILKLHQEGILTFNEKKDETTR